MKQKVKFVQITVSWDSDPDFTHLYALDTKGELWYCLPHHKLNKDDIVWHSINSPEIEVEEQYNTKDGRPPALKPSGQSYVRTESVSVFDPSTQKWTPVQSGTYEIKENFIGYSRSLETEQKTEDDKFLTEFVKKYEPKNNG